MNNIALPTRIQIRQLKVTTRTAMEEASGSPMADGKKTDARVEKFIAKQYNFNTWYDMRSAINNQTYERNLYPGFFGEYIRDYDFDHERELSHAEALGILLEKVPQGKVSHFNSHKRGSGHLVAQDIRDINEDFLNKGFVIIEETGAIFRAIYRGDDTFFLMKKEKTPLEFQQTPLSSCQVDHIRNNAAIRIITNAGQKFVEDNSYRLEDVTLGDVKAFAKLMTEKWSRPRNTATMLLRLYELEGYDKPLSEYIGQYVIESPEKSSIAHPKGLATYAAKILTKTLLHFTEDVQLHPIPKRVKNVPDIQVQYLELTLELIQHLEF